MIQITTICKNMTTIPKKISFLIIGLAFLISLIISNDFTLPYYVIVVLFLLSFVFLTLKKIKISFILSSTLLIIYTYQIGIYCFYFMQDFMPHIDPYDRILGYRAMGTLPFVFLSLISIWLVYKASKTKKDAWYIAFICLIILSGLGGNEGYGSNYLFKIALIGLNIISFSQIKAAVNKT